MGPTGFEVLGWVVKGVVGAVVTSALAFLYRYYRLRWRSRAGRAAGTGRSSAQGTTPNGAPEYTLAPPPWAGHMGGFPPPHASVAPPPTVSNWRLVRRAVLSVAFIFGLVAFDRMTDIPDSDAVYGILAILATAFGSIMLARLFFRFLIFLFVR